MRWLPFLIAVWIVGLLFNLMVRADMSNDDIHTAVGKSILWPLFVIRFLVIGIGEGSHGAVRMKLPPGPSWALRRVVAVFDSNRVELRDKGKMLKLECGHVQWRAGFDFTKVATASVGGINLWEMCLEHPCYRPGRMMGTP